MTIDRAWIAERIPHQGTMCLLDRVIEWSAETIRCVATGHRLPDHPLRSHGALHAAAGIEYAAQAMAVHGALGSGDGGRPRAGFLASVRSVALFVERLDDIDSEIEIAAQRLGGDGNNVIYEFQLTSCARPLLSGRATVILDAGDPPGAAS